MNRIIDVHSHMFNGLYLPLEEILDHAPGRLIPRASAICMAAILKAIIARKSVSAFAARDWLKLAEAIEEDGDLLARAIADFVQEEIRSECEGEEAEKQLAGKQGSPGQALLDHVVALVEEDRRQRGEAIEAGHFRSEIVKRLTVNRLDAEAEKTRKGLLERIFAETLFEVLRRLLDLAGSFKSFLCKMLSDDSALFDALLNKRYEATNLPALAIHLTMDVEPAYRVKNQDGQTIGCDYAFETEQIARSGGFIREAQGRLLGFVAFHPERGMQGIENCFKALDAGHIGIKIYPPMNYRPDGEGWEDGGKHTEVRDYTGVLTALYKRCVKEGTPIIAHCTSKGFEPWKGTGPLSDPVYWRKVLDNPLHVELRGLRLCLAHSGGGSSKDFVDIYQGKYGLINMGWYSKPDEWPEKKGYAGEIVTLCREFDNVYMDFSYLFEIIDRDDYRENLVANLKREMLASGKLADRIMYGSDWPMPAMASRTNEFLDALRGIFNGSGFGPQFADKFFFTNAVRFLNLEGFIERHEHKSFFSKESLDHLKHVCEMAK